MFDRQALVDTYDEVVSDLGTPTVAEGRDAFVAKYEQGVLEGRIKQQEFTLRDEALAAYRQIVEPERQKRRGTFLANLENITNTVLGHGDGEGMDPMLRLAFPVSDGTDKTLGAWTTDDFDKAILTRYRGAAEATSSAGEFDAVAQQISQLMTNRGATTLGELF